ncbi:PEPxxWA-CTERM sorting domain-containing protein [Phenylobacterium sp.]|uniref:PEPxxWA-CTERM sorting domain-containing protein n=1 Tax=Phenylobacterium sp. TaxID=1871053 RepID=UPI003562D352
MRKLLLGAGAAALMAIALPASAATVFFSDFNDVAVADHGYTTVSSVDGWTGGANGIELQDNVAGSPVSGLLNDNFVELDSTANSSMFRTIDAGTYDLSFLYSARPGIAQGSNGISVYLNGVLLNPPGNLDVAGGSDTQWTTQTAHFTATANSVLSFAATGTSDSLGGYLDNIQLSTAVPEPTSWAMMIVGFFGLGATLRRARRTPVLVRA